MAGKSLGGGGPQQASLGARVLIIEGRFHEDIADQLAEGAIATLEQYGCTHERIGVPGALEIPQVLMAAIESGLFDAETSDAPFDGAIALGSVIRGETYHFEVVCNNANHWLMEAAMTLGVPVGNGILTVDTKAQAVERAQGGSAGKGGDAARAVLRLIELRRSFAGDDT